MRGRKPKPDAVKALEGNPGKRKRRKDVAALPPGEHPPEPLADQVATLKVPPPPDHLTPLAREEWQRLAPELVKLGLLRRLDMGSFESRCELYATARRCREAIVQQGATYDHKGLTRLRPEVRLEQDCLRQIRQYDSEFGLTPAARARVAHVTGDPGAQPRLPGLDKPPPKPAAGAPVPPQQPPEHWPDDDFFRGPPN